MTQQSGRYGYKQDQRNGMADQVATRLVNSVKRRWIGRTNG